MTKTDIVCMDLDTLREIGEEIRTEIERRQKEREPTPLERAVLVARGEWKGSEEGREVKGAWNDYNSRGRGSTTARRVLRNGSWEWLSAPASRGRYLAGDCKDRQYGPVYEGEIVAEYTLGNSRPTPDKFYISVRGIEKPFVHATNFVRTKTGFKVVFGGEEFQVSNPSWK